MFHLTTERPDDGPAIEALLDRAFGPGRESKISYRYRQDVPPIGPLSRVARADADGRLLGTIRYWEVTLGRAHALLLGPIAVEPELKGRGIGVALMRDTLDAAAWMGYSRVVLVGDIGYYARFGFVPGAPLGLVMPGEKPERLLACALAKDAFKAVTGTLQPRRSLRGGGLIAA